jgi:hypothetical protein
VACVLLLSNKNHFFFPEKFKSDELFKNDNVLLLKFERVVTKILNCIN